MLAADQSSKGQGALKATGHRGETPQGLLPLMKCKSLTGASRVRLTRAQCEDSI